MGQKLAAASGAMPWSRALDSTGVLVLDAGSNAGASVSCPLRHSAGVVLGSVFGRDVENPLSAARVAFDDGESARIVATGGQHLFERYWGRYVAVVRNSASDEVWVLRDPSGGLPCWCTTHDGVTVLCSDLDDCRELEELSFTVNWDYIVGWVAHSGQQIRETALHEVTELQPGECLRFCAETVQRSMRWNPLDIARNARFESAGEAVEALRTTTIGCVQTWACRYPGILHNLSGGLDSSIVLSCLVTTPSRPKVTCLNYFASGPNEDERRYARMMAQHAGVELVECELGAQEVRLEELLKLRRAPRPWFYMYELEHGPFENQLAARHQASGLFSGSGGDCVFYRARPDLAVTDYVFDHGLRRGLLDTAIDAARMSRKSIWSLLFQAIRHRIRKPEWDPFAVNSPLPRTIVSPEVAALAKGNGLRHPWLTPEVARDVAPGILWHITSLSVPPDYYSSFRRWDHAERIMPLLSQPLVELCLRIPTYLLIRSGRDRALARRAFANDLPTQIVRRTAKGRADQHFRDVLDANLGFLRELLLDGLLVQRGLLSRESLELYLTRGRAPSGFQHNEILHEHACTEAWLRSWLTSACVSRG